MIFNSLIVTRTNNSQGLQKNSFLDWIKRIYFILNGHSEQLGLLDYLVPVFGLIKCIHHYSSRLMWYMNRSASQIAFLISLGLAVFVLATYLCREILCLPKNITALILSPIGAAIAWIDDLFSAEKPPRHAIATLFLQADAVRLPTIQSMDISEFQAKFSKEQKMFDNPVHLQQLLGSTSLANFFNNYFLYIFIANKENTRKYFITFNPLENFKGYEWDSKAPSPNRFNINFSIVFTDKTIFLELNFKNASLINRLRSHPEFCNQGLPELYDLNNKNSNFSNHLWLKIPEQYVEGSSSRIRSRIMQLPLFLILPPQNEFKPYTISRYLGDDITTLITDRLKPDVMFKQLPEQKRNGLIIALIKTLLNLNSIAKGAEEKVNPDENKLELQQQKTAPAHECMLQVFPKIGFFRLSELLKPLNRQHASQIKSIIGM